MASVLEGGQIRADFDRNKPFVASIKIEPVKQ